MDSDKKAKLVEALRSGQYRQGRRALRTADGGFCVLGVACDVLGDGRWEQTSPEHLFRWEFVCDGSSCRAYPPPFLRERLGLTEEECDDLVDLNDGGTPFDELATYIEQNL